MTSQDTLTTYYQAWRDKDWDTVRSMLADDVTFRGPLGSADNADEFIEGIRAASDIVTDIVVHKVIADGPDVLAWYDLHTSVAPPAPTANWCQIDNGKINRMDATFDARPLAAAVEGN